MESYIMEKIIFNEKLEELSLMAVSSIFSKIREVGKIEKEIFIGLSGGNSLKSFYEEFLSLSSSLEKEYFKKVRFFLVDERIVNRQSSDLNLNQIKKTFLDKLVEKSLIDKNQILEVNLSAVNITQDYSKKVKKLDILLLGSGEDGHICSLFPNHSSIANETKEKFILVENSPKLPPKRISISKNFIKTANCSFLFFIGESKREAYEKFKNDEVLVEKLPNKLAKYSKLNFIVTNLKK